VMATQVEMRPVGLNLQVLLADWQH
jgi:hypothetical protein